MEEEETDRGERKKEKGRRTREKRREKGGDIQLSDCILYVQC